MPPGLRKLLLAVHIALSVGWIGAVAAYIALDLAATTSRDAATVRAAYLGIELIAGSVIAPLAVAALITGLVMSLGTKWGLFRHYWVMISLVLTIVASVVLLVEIRTINALAASQPIRQRPTTRCSSSEARWSTRSVAWSCCS